MASLGSKNIYRCAKHRAGSTQRRHEPQEDVTNLGPQLHWQPQAPPLQKHPLEVQKTSNCNSHSISQHHKMHAAGGKRLHNARGPLGKRVERGKLEKLHSDPSYILKLARWQRAQNATQHTEFPEKPVSKGSVDARRLHPLQNACNEAELNKETRVGPPAPGLCQNLCLPGGQRSAAESPAARVLLGPAGLVGEHPARPLRQEPWAG